LTEKSDLFSVDVGGTMSNRLHFAGVYLALAAMVLRALLPAGWMPNPAGAGQSPFIICTAQGPVWPGLGPGHGKSTPDDGHHNHEECPFAAAPHIAAPAGLAQLIPPSIEAKISRPALSATTLAYVAAYQPQSPRAPPLFV
jgi:Protein of unknown function (DUF2946)